MQTAMASLFVLLLACACVQGAKHTAHSELLLEPGTFVEGELNTTPGESLRIVLHGRGPGFASYELKLANGQVFADGTLKMANLARSYAADELPLRLTLTAVGDEPARIEWELQSRAPVFASWSEPAPRDG